MVNESVKMFAELVDRFSYIGKHEKEHIPLTNLTFFAGAGFSKSWNKKFPTNEELFNLTEEDLKNLDFRWSHTIEYISSRRQELLSSLNLNTFKDLVYDLNMQLKYPSIRTRYIDENNIKIILNEIKVIVQRKFEKLVPLNYFDTDFEKFIIPTNRTISQDNILRFFRCIIDQKDGSRGYATGIRLNFITTNYDFLIEAILDNIIELDDYMLLYTYRGITPTHYCGFDNLSVVHNHWLNNSLIKINGGFEVLKKGDDYHFDYRKRDIKSLIDNAPVIMLPSKEQDYTDHYFASIFPKAVRLLQESRILVIVGYAMPEEDALIRFLLRQFAEDERDITDKYIFYIDKVKMKEQHKRLRNCFEYMWGINRKNIFTYSRGFARWVKEVLQQLQYLNLDIEKIVSS